MRCQRLLIVLHSNLSQNKEYSKRRFVKNFSKGYRFSSTSGQEVRELPFENLQMMLVHEAY